MIPHPRTDRRTYVVHDDMLRSVRWEQKVCVVPGWNVLLLVHYGVFTTTGTRQDLQNDQPCLNKKHARPRKQPFKQISTERHGKGEHPTNKEHINKRPASHLHPQNPTLPNSATFAGMDGVARAKKHNAAYHSTNPSTISTPNTR